jgi:glutamine synthetase
VAESLDYVAGELEGALGAKPTEAKLQSAVLSVLKQLIHQHKRVIFDGDNYSEEWHAEAERRGLPNLKDSVAAFGVLRDKKNTELFKKYGVLTRAEVDSRTHIAIEKYIKQLGIEAETMVSMAKNQILPAALQHQQRVAEAVAATQAAGVECADSVSALRSFVDLVTNLRKATAVVEQAAAHHESDPMKHATRISQELKPAMAELRNVVDNLETIVAADLWPLPTYRDLLFLK